MKHYDFAVGLVKEAGEFIKQSRLGNIQVFHKGTDERDVVTKIDLEVSGLLISRIQQNFPEHRIYSEEGAGGEESSTQEYEWVLDPVDGTANFSRGIPHFAVCVGLLHKGVPMVGAIYNPITGELFSFEKGRGAFLNDQPIHVSSTTDPAQAQGILVIGHKAPLWDWGVALYRAFLEHLKKLKAFGSSSLDLCFVAAGRAEVVVYGTFSAKDSAAAVGLLREAGGEIYTPQGEPILLSKKAQPIVVTNNKEMFKNLEQHLSVDLLPS